VHIHHTLRDTFSKLACGTNARKSALNCVPGRLTLSSFVGLERDSHKHSAESGGWFGTWNPVGIYPRESGVSVSCPCWNKLLQTWWLKQHKCLLLEVWTEKSMAPHSSTLAWKIPWMEGPGGLQSMGLLGVGHDWATSLYFFTFMHWRRRWQPTPVFLPGESQGQESLVSAVYGVAQSRTRLKWLSSSSITDSKVMNLSKLQEIVKDGEAILVLQSMRSQSQVQLSDLQQHIYNPLKS